MHANNAPSALTNLSGMMWSFFWNGGWGLDRSRSRRIIIICGNPHFSHDADCVKGRTLDDPFFGPKYFLCEQYRLILLTMDISSVTGVIFTFSLNSLLRWGCWLDDVLKTTGEFSTPGCHSLYIYTSPKGPTRWWQAYGWRKLHSINRAPSRRVVIKIINIGQYERKPRGKGERNYRVKRAVDLYVSVVSVFILRLFLIRKHCFLTVDGAVQRKFFYISEMIFPLTSDLCTFFTRITLTRTRVTQVVITKTALAPRGLQFFRRYFFLNGMW